MSGRDFHRSQYQQNMCVQEICQSAINAFICVREHHQWRKSDILMECSTGYRLRRKNTDRIIRVFSITIGTAVSIIKTENMKKIPFLISLLISTSSFAINYVTVTDECPLIRFQEANLKDIVADKSDIKLTQSAGYITVNIIGGGNQTIYWTPAQARAYGYSMDSLYDYIKGILKVSCSMYPGGGGDNDSQTIHVSVLNDTVFFTITRGNTVGFDLPINEAYIVADSLITVSYGATTPRHAYLVKNLYNSNGTITSNRSINMNGKSMVFSDATDGYYFGYAPATAMGITDANASLTITNAKSSGSDAAPFLMFGNMDHAFYIKATSADSSIHIKRANSVGSKIYLEGLNTDQTADSIAGKVGGGLVWVPYLLGGATLNFPSTAAGDVSDLTITVTGAAVGDPVALGIGDAAITTTATFTAWVSATNTVTVRFSPKATEDPASATFKVRVLR